MARESEFSADTVGFKYSVENSARVLALRQKGIVTISEGQELVPVPFVGYEGCPDR